jgi:guanylate kinase
MNNKKIVVIAGPSGSGKNTLIRSLKERYPHIETLVTATTRTARPGEEEGKDYHFMTIERFDEEAMQGKIAGQRFVPLFGGVHYGIYVPDLEKKLAVATTIFAPVDLQGALWLKEHYGALTIFIMPESFEEYRSRVRTRSREMSEREFEMRMKIAEEEVRIHAPRYDYRVVNADGALSETTEQVIEILKKEGYTL